MKKAAAAPKKRANKRAKIGCFMVAKELAIHEEGSSSSKRSVRMKTEKNNNTTTQKQKSRAYRTYFETSKIYSKVRVDTPEA